MAEPSSFLIERRDFIRRVVPTCALGCLGVCGSAGAAVAAAAKALPCQEEQEEKHKFDAEFPVPLTLRQYFARQLGVAIEPLQAVAADIGEDRLIPILERYSFERGSEQGSGDSDRRGVTDFYNYNERFRSGEMQWIITYTIIEDTENAFEIEVTECALVDPIQEAGAGLLGNAWLCHGDYGHAHGYNPKIELIRDKTLMKGDPVCNHRYEWTG
jgi:hypothetical protein